MTVTYCARCDKPLKDDDAEPINMAAPTGSGTTMYVCKTYCRSAPTQTAPYSKRH
ncbi:hypothetical protein QFZ43_004898 [Streptomyces afghaniensis]|nr:hypothetical protein [Streptomyces afghaniensis]